MRTVCGSEFQTDSAENRKARLEKSVLINGWSNSGIADEHKVLQFGSVGKLEWTCHFVCQNCQLVCDLLLDWQPMQLVQ